MLANTELSRFLPELIDPSTLQDPAIRPASIDLSVGRIFVPPENDQRQTEVTTSYIVPVGGTLIVETAELLSMPPDHGGLMFPKSSALAEKGMLITNFGCVDPGYRGNLKFVIINLGRKPFGIRQGDRVVTLVLFKLTSTAKPDYQEYIKGRPLQLTSEETSRLLSHDLVDVARRASEEARSTINSSILTIGTILSLFIVAPSILLALAPPLLAAWTSYGSNDARLDAIESSFTQEISLISSELDELRTQVTDKAD